MSLHRDAERWRGYLLLVARAHFAVRPGDASDVVQCAMLDATRQRGHFRGTTDAEYAAWLRRILAGRIADAYRARYRGKRDERLVRSLDVSSAGLESALIARHSSPSEQAVRAEELFRLADALNALPDAQRQAVLLRHAQAQSLDAMAKTMGRSPAAVAGLLKRGLKQLRSVLHATETVDDQSLRS